MLNSIKKTAWLLAIIAIGCISNANAQVYCGFDDGSARYTFENSLDNHIPSEAGRDLVGPTLASGNQALYVVNATAPQGNYVASFNGTNQYLQYGSGSGFMANAQSALTVMMWIKPASLTGVQTLFDWGSATNGLCLRLNGGVLEAGVAKSGVLTQVSLPSLTLTTTDWFLVGVTFEAANAQLRIYGRQKGAVAAFTNNIAIGTTTNLAANTNAGGLGASMGTQDAFGTNAIAITNYYNGLMDEAIVCLNAEMPAANLVYTATQMDEYYTCITTPDSLACDNKAFVFQNSGTDLKYLRIGETPVAFSTLNDNIDGALVINAIGFNVKDNHIYGISYPTSTNTNVGNSLWKVGNNGKPIFLGKIGLPAPVGGGFDMGTCDTSGNLYIIEGGTTSTNARKININSAPYTFTTIALTVNPNTADWIYMPSVNSIGYVTDGTGSVVDKFNVIDLNGTPPLVRVQRNILKPDGTNFTAFDALTGAAWTDGFGNAYFYRNSNGNIFKLSLLTATNPIAVKYGTGPIVSLNDGCNCPTSTYAEWADLPLSYGSDTTYHAPGIDIGLGVGLTLENGGQYTAAANTDSLDDGLITIGSGAMLASGNYSISVNWYNGGTDSVFIVGYIDFNNDGDFFDAGEKSTMLRKLAAGADDLHFTGYPFSIPTDSLKIRIRISSFSTDVDRPNGPAVDGEVEDYLRFVSCGTTEICNNGIDDDCDGFIDEFDSDCPCLTSADSVYFGLCQPTCGKLPGQYNGTTNQFSASSKNTTTARYITESTPVVADIDNDGQVEILVKTDSLFALGTSGTTNTGPYMARGIHVLDANLNVKRSIVTPYSHVWSTIAVADVDNDGFSEIFMIATQDAAFNVAADRGKVFCYNYDGTLKWSSDLNSVWMTSNVFAPNLGLADFNQDGIPELYYMNIILNAQTGVQILNGGDTRPNGLGRGYFDAGNSTYMTTAADVIPSHPGLELCAGNRVLIPNIVNINGSAGNSFTTIAAPTGYADGFTSIGDIDGDGLLDVVVSSQSTPNVYAWNPRTTPTTVLASVSPAPASGSGPISIGDIDGDCNADLVMIEPNRLYAYKYQAGTFVQLAVKTIADVSGFTSQCLYDFNADGNSEIFYRDQDSLFVLQYNAGVFEKLYSKAIRSSTAWEGPVIADVDKDGSADMLVMGKISASGVAIAQGDIFKISYNNRKWVPTRHVYNQFNYNPAAINDDLTVPQFQQNAALTYGTGPACNKPLNRFMAQPFLMDKNSNPLNIALPDIAIKINSTQCINAMPNLVLNYTLSNTGSFDYPANTPIAIYRNNPQSGTPNLITVIYNDSIIPIGGSITISDTIKNPTNAVFTLYIVANDTGHLTTVNLANFPVTNVEECNYLNNIDSLVITGCPEICNNGIDDDGDGYVDEFDSDCPCLASTDSAYFGLCQPTCGKLPESNLNPFGVTVTQTTTARYMVFETPIMADIDNDGQVEAIVLRDSLYRVGGANSIEYHRNIEILNAKTLAIERTITTFDFVSGSHVAVADVDNDGIGEIIMYVAPTASTPVAYRNRLVCYEIDGSIKWVSDATWWNTNDNWAHGVNIADFNQDGIPEAYIGGMIFNAQTGKLLLSAFVSSTIGVGWGYSGATRAVATVAADVIPSHPGLELCAGNRVYVLDFTSLDTTTGNSYTVLATPSGYEDGFTSVADIDLDGNLDVIVSSEGSPHFYVWNPRTQTVIASVANPPTGLASTTISIASVGDVDGDCKPEMIFVRPYRLSVYKYDGTTTLQNMATINTSDASGITYTSLFDFNADGKNEICYRDEDSLYIFGYNGTSFYKLFTNRIFSGTKFEGPSIVDGDNDGSADIYVMGSVSSTVAGNNANLYKVSYNLRKWAPTREVWNQYVYSPAFINEDLTIPQFQQNGAYTYGTGPACNKPLNIINAQTTLLDKNSNPLNIALPDIALTIDSVTCFSAATKLIIKYTISNNGSFDYPANTPIAIYNGNPQVGTPVLLKVVNNDSILNVGDSFTQTDTINTPTTPFTLYILTNVKFKY